MDHIEKDHFTRFPYRYEVRDNGDINNGGFDLVENPEKINDIHEIKDFPWFKDFIAKVNSHNGKFMTFGCAIGYENDILYGYIDFSLRPDVPEELKSNLVNLDMQFMDFVSDSIPDEATRQQAIQYLQKLFLWTSSPLQIYGESYSKVNLTFRERQQEGLVWAFDYLTYFLTEFYPKHCVK